MNLLDRFQINVAPPPFNLSNRLMLNVLLFNLFKETLKIYLHGCIYILRRSTGVYFKNQSLTIVTNVIKIYVFVFNVFTMH